MNYYSFDKVPCNPQARLFLKTIIFVKSDFVVQIWEFEPSVSLFLLIELGQVVQRVAKSERFKFLE